MPSAGRAGCCWPFDRGHYPPPLRVLAEQVLLLCLAFALMSLRLKPRAGWARLNPHGTNPRARLDEALMGSSKVAGFSCNKPDGLPSGGLGYAAAALARVPCSCEAEPSHLAELSPPAWHLPSPLDGMDEGIHRPAMEAAGNMKGRSSTAAPYAPTWTAMRVIRHGPSRTGTSMVISPLCSKRSVSVMFSPG